jgi:prefoldin subunit 5
METNRTRIPAANQQKIAKLNKQIEEYEAKIAECKRQIEALSMPQVTLREIGAKIKEMGLTRNDVMRMLNQMEEE